MDRDREEGRQQTTQVDIKRYNTINSQTQSMNMIETGRLRDRRDRQVGKTEAF